MSNLWRRLARPLPLLGASALLAAGAFSAWAIITDLGLVKKLHPPVAEHIGQSDFTNLVKAGQGHDAFLESFEHGDELFATVFNASDGVGANVGNGLRFTRVPRADLTGPGQWAKHTPPRVTGPNAQSCNACHLVPADDGSGTAADFAIRDPFYSARLNGLITRDTPHLFGLGATQLLAEEMTRALFKIRSDASAAAKTANANVTRDLVAKGVNYGQIIARADGSFDTSKVQGISADLVVRPFQWKGSVAFIRDFVRDAAHNELGMQGVEVSGDNFDGDGDGVVNELLIGDITALTVYNASQPTPLTKVEMAILGLIPPLSSAEKGAIVRGLDVFVNKAQCANCHKPVLLLDSPIFREPSPMKEFRDTVMPAGQDPIARGLDWHFPIQFDLTKDIEENAEHDSNGNVTRRLGNFHKDGNGKTIVPLFGDLKRHYMGAGLAESVDEKGTGAAVFMTRNLWGVGTTAPYLHDGRATTLTEAILEHGGEAAGSRSAFTALPEASQRDLLAFLNNLVLFKLAEED